VILKKISERVRGQKARTKVVHFVREARIFSCFAVEKLDCTDLCIKIYSLNCTSQVNANPTVHL